MKNKLWIVVITVAFAGALYAEHTYEKVASAHDIMELVQKPNMDALAAMMKAGGPRTDKDWKHAKAHASLLAESSQLLLMAGRIKDNAWEDGAKTVISAAKASMQAAEAKDIDTWKTATAGIGKGCRGCHKVHKPKKKK
jgi:cytochrome c556